MKDRAARAIAILIREYQPSLVILYGSIARGDFTEDSDIDVACFCRHVTARQESRKFKQSRLDAWIYDLQELDAERSDFLRFGDGQIIYSNGIDGEAFLTRIRERILQGPEALSIAVREALVGWVMHMLQRAAGDSIESRFRRTWLACELLEVYFQLRCMWFLGSKRSFNWLELHDPDSFELFRRCYYSVDDLDIVRQLVERVISDTAHWQEQ